MITEGLQPYVNTTDEPPIYFLGLPTILRATGQTTNGAFGLVENVMPPGFASPYGRSSSSLKDAVDRVRAQHVAAVNAGDLEAALDIFAPDAAVMPPGEPVLQGASLRAWFTHVFANFSLRGFEVRPDAVDQHGNAVIEHGNWNATLQPKNGTPSQPVGGTYVTAYARLANGSVRVVRDIFNGMPG